MPGEADYGVANEWLTRADRAVPGSEHPGCRCLALEWSVWSGRRDGRSAGPRRCPGAPGHRADHRPTRASRCSAGSPPPPRRRSPSSSPGGPAPPGPGDRGARPTPAPVPRTAPGRLPGDRAGCRRRPDHRDGPLPRRTRLPRGAAPPRGDGARGHGPGRDGRAPHRRAPSSRTCGFDHPIVAPVEEKATIRLAALASAPGRVDVVLRTAATGFQLDHFRAICRFGAKPPDPPD